MFWKIFRILFVGCLVLFGFVKYQQLINNFNSMRLQAFMLESHFADVYDLAFTETYRNTQFMINNVGDAQTHCVVEKDVLIRRAVLINPVFNGGVNVSSSAIFGGFYFLNQDVADKNPVLIDSSDFHSPYSLYVKPELGLEAIQREQQTKRDIQSWKNTTSENTE